MEEKLDTLVEIVHYGLEWLDGYGLDEASNALETIAHQIACALYQWFKFESVGTAETLEILNLASGMTKEEIKFRIMDYINILQD